MNWVVVWDTQKNRYIIAFILFFSSSWIRLGICCIFQAGGGNQNQKQITMMKTVKNSLRYGKHLRSCTANRMRVAPLSMVEGLKQFQSSAAVDQDMATRLQGFDKPTVWGEFAPLAKELDGKQKKEADGTS